MSQLLEDIKEGLYDIQNTPPAKTTASGFLLNINKNVDYSEANQKEGELILTCRSESTKDTLYVQHYFYENNRLIGSCNCPHFEDGNMCKHAKAGTYYIMSNTLLMRHLNELKQQNNSSSLSLSAKKITDKPIVDVFNLQQLKSEAEVIKKFKNYESTDIFQHVETYFKIETIGQEKASFIYSNVYKTKHKLQLTTYHEQEFVQLKCNCKLPRPCIHQEALLYYFKRNDFRFFRAIMNPEKSKEIALEQTGIPESLKKNIVATINIDGSVLIEPTNEQAGSLLNLMNLENDFLQKQKDIQPAILKPLDDRREYSMIFYVLNRKSPDFGFYFIPLAGKLTKKGELAKKFFNLDHYLNYSILDETQETINLSKEITSRLEKNGLDSLKDYFSSIIHDEDENFYEDPHDTVYQYWKDIAKHPHVYINTGLDYENNFERIILNSHPITTNLEIEENNGKVTITPLYNVISDDKEISISLKPLHFVHSSLIKYLDRYYLIAKESAAVLHNILDADLKPIEIELDVFSEIKDQILYTLMARHKVIYKTESLKPEIIHQEFSSKKIYLKEYDDFLMLVPAFVYEYEGESYEAEMDGSRIIKIHKDNKTVFIHRDWETENQIRERLQLLHTSFSKQLFNHYFYLNQQEILINNWFFNAFEEIRQQGFEILGIKDLKKLKYSPYKAKINVSASSGIDWFDLTIDISFGDEKVSLADLRKALFNNQKFVTLSNGSIGMLPEEWVSKFGRIITGGKVKKDNLGFSQIQYGLIDHLYGEIHNNHSLLEFHQKRQKLLAFETIEHKALPENINATLRDYQIGGFQWLHFLDEFGWGGCLADDMGLGKTLQMLTFIQSKVNENPETKILVVVPASLIFNWQREAEKFTPFLKVLKHTGTTREKEHSLFNKHHIILTTYALMRIDIESLKDFEFDYVILDESQAIKNPSAQTAKAAKILKAKNRLIMTGTPIENNTFDLYSQFDFLNPGLLGSVDYFREQFANPIDKERDEKAAEALRRLIYPFIISRKKEQVAKELPPKTETVIFCEMGKAQRKVYDTYKNKIREDLTKTIEEQGLGKSGIAVLQGLTKLRQICNSPALLSDDDISIHDSVKLDTLMENIIPVIEENHKVLIFSFFVEMLELVKARIQKENIQYAWITGQTTQREQQVQNFQQDENCKVFLISLKAGGVGLNLTAADYVYLIDPWWNPAVEQQAIDRAHRIGQTQNVFAYKMICKDTIEEKILQLQEKKKAVASELVNIEQGVLKKLSKDDVLTLFE